VKLGVVTDIHVCPPGAPPAAWHNPYDLERAVWRLELALERLEDEGVEAIAVLGDLTSKADAGSVERCLTALRRVRVPLRIVPGNHDAEPGGVDLATAVTALGEPHVTLGAPSGETLAGRWIAGVGIGRDEAADRWLVGAVEADDWGDAPVVLLSHSPLIDREAVVAAAGLRNAGTFGDPSGVQAALTERSGPTVVLHGHFHVRDAVVRGPVVQIGFAALIEPPNEVAVVELAEDDGRLVVDVRRLPVEPVAAARQPVLVPERQRWRFAAGAWVADGPS
jgi:predicted phosphodiesterase